MDIVNCRDSINDILQVYYTLLAIHEVFYEGMKTYYFIDVVYIMIDRKIAYLTNYMRITLLNYIENLIPFFMKTLLN